MTELTIIEEGWVNINGNDFSVSENPIFDDLYQLIYENGIRKRVIITELIVKTKPDFFAIKGDQYIYDQNKWIKIESEFYTVADKNEYRNLSTGVIVPESEAKQNGTLKNGYGNSAQYYIYSLKPIFEPIFSGAIKRKIGI